jgi:hypothetical protein
LKKVPHNPTEKGLGLLGIGSMFKNKFAIGKSRKLLKKLAAKHFAIKTLLSL